MSISRSGRVFPLIEASLPTKRIGIIRIPRSTATSVIVYVRSILKVSTHSSLSVNSEAQLASKCVPQAAAFVTVKATIQRVIVPIAIQLKMMNLEPRNSRR